jgi:hypothetical protein
VTTHSFRAALLLVGLLASSVQAQRRPADATRGGPEPLPGLLQRTPRKAASDADELQKKLVERYNETVREVANLMRLSRGPASASDASLIDAVRRLVEAEMDLADKRDNRLALLKEYVDYLKRAEQETDLLLRAGGARGTSDSDLSRIRYARLTAEIRLLRAQRDKSDQP